MNGRKRSRAGFTLVELLVVVVIIGMLVALLVPAVQSARRAAIKTKCINHQRELALAITHYESAKGSFPSYVTKVRAVNVSWVIPIFSYLGRQELWEAWRDGSAPPPSPQKWEILVNQLVCPADSEAATGSNPLSYVVNRNLFRVQREAYDNQNQVQAPPGALAAWTKKVSMSDIKSQQNTVLLMEGVDPRIQLNSPLLPPIYYVYDPPPPNPPPLKPVYLRPNLDMDPDKTNLTFNWDWKNLSVASPPRPTLPTTVGVLRKSPHPGGVVMAFCDGRVEFINDEAEVNATTFSYGPDWVP